MKNLPEQILALLRALKGFSSEGQEDQDSKSGESRSYCNGHVA